MELKARQMEIDLRSQVALDNLLASNDGAKSLFDQAAGYAVFEITKAGGLMVTGAGGSGVAVNKASGSRSYMRMGSGGVGFGIGVQNYDLIVMFEDEPHLMRFMDGGWDSSATAQAAAGQEGINLTSSFIDGVAFFQVTDKGLIAIADVAGTRFWVADTLN
jgi:lipid-binding SYLF domain-containing protein